MEEKDLVTLLAEAKEQGKQEKAAEFQAKLDAIKSAQDQKDAIEAAVKSAKEEAYKEAEANFKANRKTTYAGKTAKVGDDSEGMEAFGHYLKSGEIVQELKSLTEGSAAGGGVLVPNAFYNQVQTLWHERSTMRALGATVVQTDSKILDVPRIVTGTAAAAYTAEGSAYADRQPVTDLLQITLYKATAEMSVTEEWLSDAKTDINAFLAAEFARAFAGLENSWFFTGNGSNQPYGVTARAQLGVTAVATGTIAAGEMFDLIYTVGDDYRTDGKFAMRAATLSHLQQKTGNPFQFVPTPQGGGRIGSQGQIMLGTPVYTNSGIAAIAPAAKVVYYGDWSRYFIVENGGLRIVRDDSVYRATGKVGFFARTRLGGDLAVTEAVKYLVMGS